MLCPSARTHLATLRTLTDDFTRAYEEGKRTGDLTHARILKRTILETQAELELLLDPLREVLAKMEAPSLREQYDTQQKLFEDLGLLETLSSGERGIKDPEGHEYPFPAYRDIQTHARENKEVLTHKAEQGFVRLQITPFALSIPTLKEIYARELRARHAAGTLTSTDGTTLDLDTTEPVWMWNGYTEQELVYFPREFSANHSGLTKQDALTRDGGFRTLMTEDLTDIPRTQSEHTTVGGRKQLDAKGDAIKSYIKAGKTIASPDEYLRAMQQDSTYAHEEGYTPEDWFMHAILRMRASGVTLDDYQAKNSTGKSIGSACYALGAHFPVSGYVVPYGCWNRDDRRARVGRNGSGVRRSDVGVRSAVRLKRP